MRLDVVVPTYGRPQDLEGLLATLRAQTRRPDRILVCDDTPGDAVERVVAAHPEAEYHRNPGRMSSALARNHGIEVSTGDLVTFLDNDVRLAPTYLERIEAAFAAHPEAVGGMGHVTNLPFMGAGRRAIAVAFSLNHRTPTDCRLLPNLNTTYPMEATRTQAIDWLWGCNLTVRREALDAGVRFETQFPRYSLYEDIEFSLQLRDAFPGRTLLLVHDAKMLDARSASGRIDVDDEYRMRVIHRLYIMNKHGRRPPFIVPRLLWTDLGALGVRVATTPRLVPSMLKGLGRGWWAVATHRKDLRRADLARLNEGYRFQRAAG
jgi:GT2 family glycosyltransferase